MTRYSDFVKSYMKKSGKNWSCSVCDIQKGDLYNKHKINISRENRQMGMEDRDAPAPKKTTFKIKVNRSARKERYMMGMEDMDAPSQVKTLQPSPIPPPEPLVPADPNMTTAVPLGLAPTMVGSPDENPNNVFRIEIMLALTYLVPKRINTNSGEDKKTYGTFGRDDDGKLISQAEIQKEVRQMLRNAYGRPFTGRDANKLADEIVKPGEKSHRIKVIIHFMNNQLNIGLPTEAEVKAGDWKFKYYGQYAQTYASTKSSKKHSNLFGDLYYMMEVYNFSDPSDVGLVDVEEEVPLVLKPLDIPGDGTSLEELFKEYKELGPSYYKRVQKKQALLEPSIAKLVLPMLKAELEQGYYTAYALLPGGILSDTLVKVKFGFVDGVLVIDGEPNINNVKDPYRQLWNALSHNYIWKLGWGHMPGIDSFEEFKKFVPNLFPSSP